MPRLLRGTSIDKSRRFNTWYWVAAIVGILLIQYLIGTAQQNADKVAALTPGFTGADLANLVNEAVLLATRRGATR